MGGGGGVPYGRSSLWVELVIVQSRASPLGAVIHPASELHGLCSAFVAQDSALWSATGPPESPAAPRKSTVSAGAF